MPKARTPAAPAFLLLSAIALSGIWSNAAYAAQGLASKDTCAPPVIGQISCDAQVRVYRRSQRPVHPKVGRRRKPRGVASTGQPAPQPLTPAYLQQAYDLSALSAARGMGDTVAIVGVYDDPSAASDLATFRSAYALPACTAAAGCFRQLNQQGQSAPLPAPDSEWAEEQSMDIEAVSSLCPNCRIDLVEATAADAQDLQAAITAAIDAGANQVSISGDGLYSQNPFTDFSAPGVSIVAATGDGGPLPSGEDAYPAALPYVTAVGATTLAPSGSRSPTPRGLTESAWSGSAAGCDTQEQPLPYQPSEGCSGRMYADVSADGDPATGLTVYDSPAGGWMDGGGTSLSAPLVAAFEAITGVDGSSPQWAYADAAELNDPSGGSTGSCAGQLTFLCDAGPGYDGPTGAGSISGQIVTGAPGIGLPAMGPAANKTYTRRVSDTAAWMLGGVYPNGQATTYYWQYGATVAYSSRTRSLSAGSGARPVVATAHLTNLKPGTRYHYRLVAANVTGTAYGYDASFVTGGRAARAATKKRVPRRGRRGQ
jgi:hypothetical protein